MGKMRILFIMLILLVFSSLPVLSQEEGQESWWSEVWDFLTDWLIPEDIPQQQETPNQPQQMMQLEEKGLPMVHNKIMECRNVNGMVPKNKTITVPEYGDCVTIDDRENCLNTSGKSTDCTTDPIAVIRTCQTGTKDEVIQENVPGIVRECIEKGIVAEDKKIICPENYKCGIVEDTYCMANCNNYDCNYDLRQEYEEIWGWDISCPKIDHVSKGDSLRVSSYKATSVRVD